MKVVLFCGGLGLRIRDASDTLPKPLVPVGGHPILWHVMQYYMHYGHTEFVLCLGHKGDVIKKYFSDHSNAEGWRITCVDTGVDTSIGQRFAMVRRHVEGDELFLANYADGLTDLRLPDIIDAFAASAKVGACICIRPSLSYHFVQTREDGTVVAIAEPDKIEHRVNGGYFVFRKEIFDYINDGEDLVAEPFQRLVRAEKLLGYRYDGFWKNMDTFKDKQALDDLHASGQAPWEVWKRQKEITAEATEDRRGK